jgi:cytochrome c
MIEGRIPGTGHLERVVFNEHGEVRRERLLGDLRQRIRHVAQGPDGLIYLLTDEDDGALLRIEPWTADAGTRAERTEANGRASPPRGDASRDAARDVLFVEHDCSACHRIEARSVGPSYLEIANRYDSADVDTLAARVVEGSVGQWGDVPMAAHSGIGVARAREMVREILALTGAR